MEEEKGPPVVIKGEVDKVQSWQLPLLLHPLPLLLLRSAIWPYMVYMCHLHIHARHVHPLLDPSPANLRLAQISKYLSLLWQKGAAAFLLQGWLGGFFCQQTNVHWRRLLCLIPVSLTGLSFGWVGVCKFFSHLYVAIKSKHHALHSFENLEQEMVHG